MERKGRREGEESVKRKLKVQQRTGGKRSPKKKKKRTARNEGVGAGRGGGGG